MNTFHLPRRRGSAGNRPLALITLLATLALICCVLELAVSRAVPWGQYVDLLVWTSFVAPLPADSALVLQASAGSRASGSESRWPARFVAWAAGWAAQVQVTVRTDQAAVITQDTRAQISHLPACLLVGDGRISLTFESLGDAGAVALRIPGGELLTIGAGTAVDLAIAPGPASGTWVPLPGDWRPIIEARLAAGHPVGRLTIVNSGLRAAARGCDWHD